MGTVILPAAAVMSCRENAGRQTARCLPRAVRRSILSGLAWYLMKALVRRIIYMEGCYMNDVVTLAHGAGGKQTAELIDTVFKTHFSNPEFTADDAAVLHVGNTKLAFTTDGFIVSPPEFPGGNIGKLSICGTVNDLACMGAKPLYLSCAFVIEEGFPLAKLDAYAAAMKETAAEAGVRIVAGDTKVARDRSITCLLRRRASASLWRESIRPVRRQSPVMQLS